MSAAELGLECLCGGDRFERVIVQRRPNPAIVTDFVACLACSAMFFRPPVQVSGPGGLLSDAKDAAKDYRKPGRR
jgi:hypothetical protein